MKRITASALASLMILACTCGTAGAAYDAETTDATLENALVEESAVVRSSLYISQYYAELRTGYSSGELRINYDVTSGRSTTSIGVSQIRIFNEYGACVTTIYGSSYNGLLRTDGSRSHSGVYSYYGSSGTAYYAQVVFYAADSYGSDCKIQNTNTILAP